MQGTDRDLALANGVKDEKEYYVVLDRAQLDRGYFFDKVVIEVDELTHYEHGSLKLILPENMGGQQNMKHQSVSGVVYKEGCGIPKGCRVFFHYLAMTNAKIQKPEAGLFIICEGKPYLVLKSIHIYVGIIDGKPVALHPDFAITEPIEREGVEAVVAPDGVTFLATMSAGGILLGENQLKEKTYEPFKCKVVSLPSRTNMEQDRQEAFEKMTVEDGAITWRDVKDGDIVSAGKSWDIPITNGIQDYFGGRKLFRTRITNINEIL